MPCKCPPCAALSKISELFHSQHLIQCLILVFRLLYTETLACFQLSHLHLYSSIPSSSHISLPDVSKTPHSHIPSCLRAYPPLPFSTQLSLCCDHSSVLKVLQSSHFSCPSSSVLQPQWPPFCSSNVLGFFHHSLFAFAMITIVCKYPSLSFPDLSWLIPSHHSGLSLNPTSSDKALFPMSSPLSSSVTALFFIILINLLNILLLPRLRVPWDHVPGLFALFCDCQSDWYIIDVTVCVGSIEGGMDMWMNG